MTLINPNLASQRDSLADEDRLSAMSKKSTAIAHRPIVVVDDSWEMRDLLTIVLSMEGHPIVSFPNGDEFLRNADASAPICVFLDIIMPGRPGLQILKELNARGYEAPIFIMSALSDAPTVVEGLKSGAKDFLLKPFDPYLAVQRVRDAVDIWNGRNEQRNASDLIKTEFPGNIRLTRREAEVLAELIKGDSRIEIAKSLTVNRRTVDRIIFNIMRKFEVNKAIDLVRIAMSA
jgi:two-component system response regulator FixJ